MKKRVIGIGILLVSGLFLWFSPLPYLIRGYLNHESFYRGMPASFWGMRLSEDIPPLPPVAEKVLPPTLLTRTATGTLAEGGRSAVPVLAELLKHENENTRCNAVYSLWLMGPEAEEAIPQIIELLDHETFWPAQESAVKFLGDRGRKARTAIPTLCRLRSDPCSYVRWEVAQTLGKVDPESRAAVPALIDLLNDEDSVVRGSAAESLGGMGSAAKESIPSLTRHLEDGDSEVQVYVVEALWKLTQKAKLVLPTLIKIVENGEDKAGAIRVLTLLGIEAIPAIPALRRALNDRYELVRKEAATLLTQLDPQFTAVSNR
jgi:HEAT repeat protein